MPDQGFASPLVDEVIENHLRDVEILPAPPSLKPAQACEVAKVAPNGPAARLGIAQGDLLLKVNGRPGATMDPESLMLGLVDGTFCYYLKSQAQCLQFSSDGLPLGIDLKLTAEAIVSKPDTLGKVPKYLFSLWEYGNIQSLIEVVNRGGTIRRALLTKIAPKLFGRFYSAHELQQLFQGVVEYESGARETGLAKIEYFGEHHAGHWTTEFTTLCLYYYALDALENNDTERACDFFRRAYSYRPVLRIADRIEELEGERPSTNSEWVGHRFPINYALPLHDDRTSYGTLASALDAQDPGQVLLVCLLSSYRCNSPYVEFMSNYMTLRHCFAGAFGGVHVVTAGDMETRPLDTEKAAIERGMPVTVFWDEDDDVADFMGISNSPTVFALNRDGEIVREERFETETAVWDLLSELENSSIGDQGNGTPKN